MKGNKAKLRQHGRLMALKRRRRLNLVFRNIDVLCDGATYSEISNLNYSQPKHEPPASQ